MALRLAVSDSLSFREHFGLDIVVVFLLLLGIVRIDGGTCMGNEI